MWNDLVKRYPHLVSCEADVNGALEILIDSYRKGGKLLLCGNGGSASDCEHIVGELMKDFLIKRPITEDKRAQLTTLSPTLSADTLDSLQLGLPAISLTSISAFNTAFANDRNPELVYAQGVLSLGREGDVLLAISTSGNAKNVLRAVEVAKGLGLTVVGLTGESGGAIRPLCDVCIRVPQKETYKVQELHLPVYHYLCAATEKHFFG